MSETLSDCETSGMPTSRALFFGGMDPQDNASGKRPGDSPLVIESFSGYEPPFNPTPVVRRMLASVPRNYLAGLSAVVLSNTSGLSGRRRKTKVKSRKRKVGLTVANGLYHPAFRGRPAWIEIFVDNALRDSEKRWWFRLPYIRDWGLSDVLFHEIGHHVHYAVRPEHREKEDVADIWKVRLQDNYNRQRYRWLSVPVRIVRLLFGGLLDRQRQKLELEMLESGYISRAEYNERNRK
jgi:hypothetical protein